MDGGLCRWPPNTFGRNGTMVDESTLNLTVTLYGTTRTRCVILAKVNDNALITLNNVSCTCKTERKKFQRTASPQFRFQFLKLEIWSCIDSRIQRIHHVSRYLIPKACTHQSSISLSSYVVIRCNPNTQQTTFPLHKPTIFSRTDDQSIPRFAFPSLL